MLTGACLIGAALLTPWRPGVVMGTSMTPTLTPGSVFVYNRDYYRTNPVRAGEIVVVRLGGKTLIKRVFAVGGDRFWARREVMGEELVHSPIRDSELNRFRQVERYSFLMGRSDAWLVHIRIPKGYLFLMGDDMHSVDSGQFGFVDAGNVLGRVTPPHG